MRALLPILIALAVAAAGCLDGGNTEETPPTTDGGPDDVAYANGDGESPAHIVDFNVTNDRDDPVFYEDDRLHLTVTVEHDASTNATAQHYLTIRAAGEILVVKSLILEPGDVATLERTVVPDRAGTYVVSATLAAERAEATLELEERPREGEWVGDGNVTFRLNAHAVTEEAVVANLTLRNTMANESLDGATATLLCRTPDGTLQEPGTHVLDRTGPNETRHTDVRFTACEGEANPHGLRLEQPRRNEAPREHVILFNP